MKTLFALLILLLIVVPSFANEIDTLTTPAEVNAFLKKTFPDFANSVLLDETNVPKARFVKNNFYKLDLDGNGLTDLLIDNFHLVAVTSSSETKYDVHPIDQGGFLINLHTLTGISYLNKTPLLAIRDYDERTQTVGDKKTEKTILMKFGEFIEYNPKPDKFNIQKIVFKEGGCFGDCPIFNMYIFGDRSVYYEAIKFNKQQGNFNTTLDQEAFNTLIRTINYIGLSRLASRYEVNWTDDAAIDLEITYNNGKVKKVHDYGMIGTFGLANLYSQLFNLSDSQRWRPAGPRI